MKAKELKTLAGVKSRKFGLPRSVISMPLKKRLDAI